MRGTCVCVCVWGGGGDKVLPLDLQEEKDEKKVHQQAKMFHTELYHLSNTTTCSLFQDRATREILRVHVQCHVHVQYVCRACCVALFLPTHNTVTTDCRMLLATDSFCNGSVIQMTVYTVNAILCSLLCSTCLPLDSKYSATQHLRLHTFLVQQWQKHPSPVYYLLPLHARTEHACQSYCDVLSRDIHVALGIHLSGQCALWFVLSRACWRRLTALEKVLSQVLLSRKAFLCSDLKIEKILCG